jgi:uracil-DNA glycosylase
MANIWNERCGRRLRNSHCSLAMHSIELGGPVDFAAWRDAARRLLRDEVAPEEVHWQAAGGSQSLFEDGESRDTPRSAPAQPTLAVPRAFLDLAQHVCLHREPQRFALLYRLLWRLRQEPRLLQVATDPDVARARAMEKSVQRDIHKMHAFVRFRQVGGCHSIAWFEPQHHIVEAAAPFFMRRFANFSWSILTPERSAHWDTHRLSFGPGASRSDAPADDACEDLWRTYYASIFNPARLKVDSMRAHMPKKYWRNLPESALIPGLIAAAKPRTLAMIEQAPTTQSRIPGSAAPAPRGSVPTADSLEQLREQAAQCRDCPLWRDATQTVFGEGARTASILFVGEQPGDMEDIAGRPFVGPAGQLLDRALTQAGIDRQSTYVTNAVKHFKFEPRGKRRIHKKPGELEIAACNGWLKQELEIVKPRIVVALGATAARALFGRAITIDSHRGRVIPAQQVGPLASADMVVTVHPSYLLRVPDEQRESAYEAFVADLKVVAAYA